ncbi:DUF2101 family protein [Pseudoalteromonas mariniglutinosa]
MFDLFVDYDFSQNIKPSFYWVFNGAHISDAIHRLFLVGR